METLEKKLQEIEELLEKGKMSYNKGQNLSSPNQPKKPEAPNPNTKKNTINMNSAKSVLNSMSTKDPVRVAAKMQDPGLVRETVKFQKNGQWYIEKEDLSKKGRCWEGYKPTPGKKAYSEDSCEKIKKQEDDTYFNIFEKKDVDLEVAPEGSPNRESYLDAFEKKDKPFHGYNSKKHSKEGGLSESYRKKYNKETGSNLKKPVTAKEAKGSDEKAGRRKSFCARMSGVKGPTSKDGKLTRKGAALKRWDC